MIKTLHNVGQGHINSGSDPNQRGTRGCNQEEGSRLRGCLCNLWIARDRVSRADTARVNISEGRDSPFCFSFFILLYNRYTTQVRRTFITPHTKKELVILMPVVVNLPSEFRTIYTNILKTTPREGTIKLITNELKRQLLEYKLIEKKLAKKYGMSFEEFKRNEVVKKENYSFEVEEDYCDWELAIDGIATIKKEIQNIEKYI